ncbi:MAG: MMPL family transporter [Actinomycetota bacterium]
MFARLGSIAVRRSGVALALTAGVLVVAALFGPGVIDRLAGSGFDDPDADSVAARAELERVFDTGFPDLAFLLTFAGSGDADAPIVDRDANRQLGLALTDEISSIDGTDDVLSYWSAGEAPTLRSTDGTRALLLLRLEGAESDEARDELSVRLLEEYDDTQRDAMEIRVGGRDAVFEHIGETAAGDLALAEAIAIPLTLLLLVFVFRTVVAALIPVLVGVATILGSLLVLFAITAVTDVSVFAINLVTTLGLGLAIDYSLLIVGRFREERANGADVDDAVQRAVRTAGRTVAFSGLTVAVSLSSLLIFPIYFLRSFAYAGIGVILFALLMSLVAVPALLHVLGHRVESLAVGRRRKRRHAISIWREQADRVLDHPWLYLLGAGALLIVAAAPFAFVEWGEADHRTLPPDDRVRETAELLVSEFDAAEANAFPIVALGGADPAAITGHAIAVSQLDGVGRVDTATGSFANGASILPADDATAARFRDAGADAAWFNVVPDIEPISPEGERLIAATRSMSTPFATTLVGGGTASFVDTKAAILDNLPLAATLLILATFVLLFLQFGSVVAPIKAIVLNLFSLGATFGLMVVVFQEGVGADLLNVTATGSLDLPTVVLIFGIAFGLSMDYEVFLLSRIKEEYDAHGHNEDAIVEGIDRTGPIVTAAALLLTITFLATATSSLAFVKLFGIGLAVAVITDAFIVRITLVPAVMALADRWNWWAPAPLRRVHERWGLSERDDGVIDLREPEALIDLTEPAEPEPALFSDVTPRR